MTQEDARQLFECRTPSLVHTHHLVVCRLPTTEILTENRLQRGCWVATAGDCTFLLIAWIESVISIWYSRCVIHSIFRNVLSLNLNQWDFISRFPRSIKYGTVPPIAITWWEAREGGSVTSNVVFYLSKVVTEKCTLTTLILKHFPIMLLKFHDDLMYTCGSQQK